MRYRFCIWLLNLRFRFLNFLSGGELQMYVNLYHENLSMKIMRNTIALKALNRDTIEAAREFYNKEFNQVEQEHFDRMTKIIKDRK